MRRQLAHPCLQLPERRGQLRPRRALRQAGRHQHLRHRAVALGHAVGAQGAPHLQGVCAAAGQVLPLQQHAHAAGTRLQRQGIQSALPLLQQQLPVVLLRHVAHDVQPHAAVVQLHGRRRTVPCQTPILPFDHVCLSSLYECHLFPPLFPWLYACGTLLKFFFARRPKKLCKLAHGILYYPDFFCAFPINFHGFIAFAKKYGILSLFAYTTSSAAFCGMKFPCSGHTVTRAY